jgi:hypothetical protein
MLRIGREAIDKFVRQLQLGGDRRRQFGANGEDERLGAAMTRLGRAKKELQRRLLVAAIEDAELHQAAPPVHERRERPARLQPARRRHPPNPACRMKT